MSNPTDRKPILRRVAISFIVLILSIISIITLLITKFSFTIMSYFISYKMLVIFSLFILLISLLKFLYNFLKLGAVS